MVEPARAETKKPSEGLVAPVTAVLPQKNALRAMIRTRVLAQRLEHACKITEMLLELDWAELKALLQNDEALYVRIEGYFNLYKHYAR